MNYTGTETAANLNSTNAKSVTVGTKWTVNAPSWTITNMQQMTSTICSKAEVGTTGKLRDNRDTHSYTVTKLADNKCWMTEDLRIINKTITSSNSDVNSSFTIPASSERGITWKVQNTAFTYNYITTFYNYYAATAGSGTYNLADKTIAPYSICPKGFKLPQYTDWNNLLLKYDLRSYGTMSNDDFEKLLAQPLNFKLYGRVFDGPQTYGNGLMEYGEHGNYWASDKRSYDYQGEFQSYGGSLTLWKKGEDNNTSYASNSGGIYYEGYPVRCVAR